MTNRYPCLKFDHFYIVYFHSALTSHASVQKSAGSCCDCWFTGEFLSLPWYLFLLDVFYLDSRGVIVVARWECARGLASGL